MPLAPRSESAVDHAFRLAMRRLAGGVAIATTADGERRYGMTMTAVMSLSMEPPSLVMAVNRTASIYRPLSEGSPFCVNLVGQEHEAMVREFSALPSEERFGVGDWIDGPNGAPCLLEAQAAVFCDVSDTHQFGSHAIIIGVVTDARAREAISPLVHLDGRYQGVAEL